MLARTLLLASATAITAAEPSPKNAIPLWNGDAPIGNGMHAPSTAVITVHLPQNPSGAAFVICPGGGYGGLVTGSEGHGIAEWLASHGIAGIVLEYRLPKGNSFLPLADAQRAIRTVRFRCEEWHIRADQIGIMGFSAGGHLASTAGTLFDEGNPGANEAVERVSCRPDFMVLIYPVITMGEKAHRGSAKNLLGEAPSDADIKRFSTHLQVTAKTPPAFLAHAENDTAVPIEHSELFYQSLIKHNVPARLLRLPEGGHGLNRYQGPMWDQWQNDSLQWLNSILKR